MENENKKFFTSFSTHRLIEIVTIFGSFTGLLIAVCWITGRAFFTGFFDAMNIPLYYITYSIWDYSELSWWIQLAIFFIIVIIGSLFYFITLKITIFILHLAKPLIKKILNIIRNRINKSNKKEFFSFSKEFKIVVKLIYFSIVGLYILVLIMGILLLNMYLGSQVGRSQVLHPNMEIDIVSKNPLDLGVPEIISSFDKKNSNYIYRNFKLLTYNEGRYFLFNSIDSINFKPKFVYIIENKNVLEIRLKPISLNK